MEMVQLNVVALAELTHLVVRRLLQEGKPRGKIMNVSSVAGFIPGIRKPLAVMLAQLLT